MDYEKIIDFDSVTLGDCCDLFALNNIYTVIHDGKVVNLYKQKE